MNSASVKGSDPANVVPAGKRSDAVANHARIVAAARAVFVERGLEGEVGEIAARAGVGVGTLYRHFANRDDILRAVLEQTFADSMAALREAVSHEDPRVALRAISQMVARVHTEFGPLFAVMNDPRLAKICGDSPMAHVGVPSEIVGVLAEMIERGMRSGYFRDDLDPRVVAATILGSIKVTFEFLGAEQPVDVLTEKLAAVHAAIVAPR